MQTTPEELRRHDHIRGPEFALFALIVTLAMIARVWNLNWGLPDVFEDAIPFEAARKFWGEPGGGISLRPESFHYGALSFYIHFFVQGIQFLSGLMSGQFGSLDAFRSAMAANPADFMISARIVSVLFDVGTVALVWLTTREVFGRGIAIGAALLAAVSPLLIAGAQGVNLDVILAFFLMMTLRQSLKLSGHAGPMEFLLTGVMIGLAASTKYAGALFLALPAVIVAADLVFGTARTFTFVMREIGLAILIPLAAAAVFIVLNPAILPDQAGFLRDFTYELHQAAPGLPVPDPGRGTAGFYLAGTLAAKLGVLFLAGAAAGVFVSFIGRNPGGVAISAMAVVYIAVISTWEMRAERYLLPAVPLLSILCSAGCLRVMEWAAARSTEAPRMSVLRPYVSRVLPGAALFAVLAVPALESVRRHLDIGKTDTRTSAREWISANLPPGSVIASGPIGIAFPPGQYTVVSIPSEAAGSEAAAPFDDARWYEDFDLLISRDDDGGRYHDAPDRFRAMRKFYDNLEPGWQLSARFEPDTARRGAAIWFFTPDSAERSGAFDDGLISRLASVDDAALVTQFVREMSRPLFLRGKAEKARQLLELGIRLNPADQTLLRSMIYLLNKGGRFDEALVYVGTAEGAGGESTEVLSLHAEILIGTGDLDGAERILTRAIGADPGAALPYTILIRVYSGKGDTARLMATLERYLAIIPGGSGESERIRGWLDSLRSKG